MPQELSSPKKCATNVGDPVVVVPADTGLPDGPYRDLYSGEEIYVFQGAVPIRKDPVIIGSLLILSGSAELKSGTEY